MEHQKGEPQCLSKQFLADGQTRIGHERTSSGIVGMDQGKGPPDLIARKDTGLLELKWFACPQEQLEGSAWSLVSINHDEIQMNFSGGCADAIWTRPANARMLIRIYCSLCWAFTVFQRYSYGVVAGKVT